MSFNLDINSLLAYLRENNFEAELQRETGQIYGSYEIKGLKIHVFFLIRQETQLLQIVAYLPYEVPKVNFGETARLLHLLNKDVDMPGFGLDENEGLMFYRSVIPCPNNTIDKRLFNMYLGTTRFVCETFMESIYMIVSGAMKVDDILNQKEQETEG